MQTINEAFKDFNQRFKSANTLLEIVEKEKEFLEEEDTSFEFLTSFLPDAKKCLSDLENSIACIDTKYIELIKMFGDTQKDLPMETVFEIMNKFNKDLTVKYS